MYRLLLREFFHNLKTGGTYMGELEKLLERKKFLESEKEAIKKYMGPYEHDENLDKKWEEINKELSEIERKIEELKKA